MVNKLANIGKGKLTNTLALIAILWAITGYFMGWVDQTKAIEIAWLGAAAFGIRRALPK